MKSRYEPSLRTPLSTFRCRPFSFLSVLFLFSLYFQAPAYAAPIKVGVSLPLTGPAATYGSDLKNLIPFLAEELAPSQFYFVFEDDQCSPRAAVNAAQSLARQKVAFVIGLPCSGATIAAAPVYERAKIPVISILGGSPKISGLSPYVFRTRPSDTQASQLLADYLGRTFHTVGLLVEETEYASGMADALMNAIPPQTKMIRESFLSGAADVRGQLLRLKAQGAERVVVFAQAETGLLLALRQAQEAKLPLPLIANWVADSDAFLKAAGTAADGIIFPGLPHPEDTSVVASNEIYKKFKAAYGRLTSVQAAFECAYAAMVVLRDASRAPDPLAKLHTTEFPGLRGPFRFTEQGDIVGMGFQLRVVDRKDSLIK